MKLIFEFQESGKRVAVKVLTNSQSLRDDEYKILQNLQHPNIVKFIAFEEEVSEYFDSNPNHKPKRCSYRIVIEEIQPL